MKKKFPRKLELFSRIESIEDAAYFAEKAAKDMDFPESDVDDIAIALTEAVSNAIIHGNKKDETKKVTIEVIQKPDRIEITISDEGKGFNPIKVDNPLKPENLLKESGRGIFILKSLMDDIEIISGEKGTIATLIKYKRKKD